MHLQADELRTEEQHAARRHMLVVEKDAILAAFRKAASAKEVRRGYCSRCRCTDLEPGLGLMASRLH